jgi:precorrin-2/cobalt-factor-2 C20-methyltransferase
MSGTLFIVGVGPGDPELLTLKAVRILGTAPHVAFFAKRGQTGHAARIAAAHLRADAEILHFAYPMTTELPPDHPASTRPLPSS